MFGMTNPDRMNALELLKSDHTEVSKMFDQYEELKDGARDSEKDELASQICDALSVHAQIEEEIFYPAARQALDEEEGKDLIDEATVEHQTLKDIIGRLESAPPSDPLYDAGVKVLSEYVKHHVKEEENELFPKLKSSEMDLEAVGQQLAARKEALTSKPKRSRGRSSSRNRGSRDTEQETSQAAD
jgi:hemerythrin-like domain-containing protein